MSDEKNGNFRWDGYKERWSFQWNGHNTVPYQWALTSDGKYDYPDLSEASFPWISVEKGGLDIVVPWENGDKFYEIGVKFDDIIDNLANFIANPGDYEDPSDPSALTQEEMKQAVIESLTNAIARIKGESPEENAEDSPGMR